MEKIKNHTHALARYTYSVLSALRYANGEPVIQVYTDTEVRTYDVQGPIINFNVLDENGGIIGYSQVHIFQGSHHALATICEIVSLLLIAVHYSFILYFIFYV